MAAQAQKLLVARAKRTAKGKSQLVDDEEEHQVFEPGIQIYICLRILTYSCDSKPQVGCPRSTRWQVFAGLWFLGMHGHFPTLRSWTYKRHDTDSILIVKLIVSLILFCACRSVCPPVAALGFCTEILHPTYAPANLCFFCWSWLLLHFCSCLLFDSLALMPLYNKVSNQIFWFWASFNLLFTEVQRSGYVSDSCSICHATWSSSSLSPWYSG